MRSSFSLIFRDPPRLHPNHPDWASEYQEFEGDNGRLTNPADGSVESQSRDIEGSVDMRFDSEARDDPLSILLVDDDRPQSDSLAVLLRLAGYTVVNAYTGVEALAVISRRFFDVVIIEVTLQDADGVTILRDMASLNGDIGALMLSGQASLSQVVDAMNQGADAFIQKPAEPGDLIAKVERIARVKRLGRELKASEVRYRELFENLGEGVFYTDPRGDFTSMNQAGAKILGYGNPNEIIGGAVNVWEAFAPGDEFETLSATAYGVREAVRHIIRFRRRDGELGWIEVTLRARRNDRGEPLGLLGTFKDVSEQVCSQEMLEAMYGLWTDLREADSLEEVGGLTLGFLKTMLGIDLGRLSVVEGELIKPVGVLSNPSDEMWVMSYDLASRAVKTGSSQLFPYPIVNFEYGPDSHRIPHLAHIAVPIKMTGGVVGVIHLGRTEGKSFSDEDVKLVESVCEIVAMALDRLVKSRFGLKHGPSLEDYL
jgi:PAS domain S-box-containing protein